MPDGRLLKIVVRDGLMSSLRRLANVVAAIGLFVVLACPLAVQAISPVDLGASRPDERVLDDAEVFSRASRSELNARLQDLAADRVDARVVTLRRLDEAGLTQMLDLLPADHPVTDLSMAAMTSGLLVDVAAGAKVTTPIILMFTGDSEAVSTHPVVLLRVGAAAEAVVADWHQSTVGLSAPLLGLDIADKAR